MNRNIITITAGMLFLLSQTVPTFAASTVQFTVASFAVALAENAGEVLLSVSRAGDLETVVTVDYLTADITAKAGEDYTAASGTLSFATGQTNQTLRINIVNDGLREATETFSVTLTNLSSNAAPGARIRNTVSIQDNDTDIQVEFPQYWAGEGTVFVVVAVVRGPDENVASTVDYTTAAQTATPGTDYTETSGTLSFTAEEKLKLITIPILNDGVKEPDEKFTFKLSNATSDVLGTRSNATVTITDNDTGIEFAMNRLWVHEDQREVCLKVIRGNDELLDPFSVQYTFIDGTAKAGEDYLSTTGTLDLAAGEMSKSICVPVINDQVQEAAEKFQVKLSNPTAGMALGRTTNLTATVTIVDATGMEPHRFQGIQRLNNGRISLELAGGVSKPFSNYFSIFQLESSPDLRQWQPLKLVGYRNSSTNPPVFTDVPAPELATRFYRMNPAPFVTPSIPPTGQYPVGIVRRFLFDPSRRNRFGISTNNSLLVTVWYPANPSSGQPIAGYDPEQHANEIDWQGALFMDRAPRFASYAILDAPARPSNSGYPVVVNSHCHGCDGIDQENLAENLASHGYVVATIDHADAPISLFPDGGLLKQSLPAISVAGTLERVKDLGFLVDELAKLNREDSHLMGAFQLAQLAAMGWSWGAMTVSEFARVDSRCLAAISFDGDTAYLPAEIQRVGLQKPSLTMNTTANSTDVLFKFATRDAYWLQVSGTIHQDFGTYWYANSASSMEAQRIIHAYVLSFLNKHLIGEDDHLLDGRSPDYPRVVGFKKK